MHIVLIVNFIFKPNYMEKIKIEATYRQLYDYLFKREN